MPSDPIARFRRWFREAVRTGMAKPEAMALATAGPAGLEGRVVSLALLSGYAHESLAARFEAVVENGKGGGEGAA